MAGSDASETAPAPAPRPDGGIAGRSALVTGASSGIGEEIAFRLAREGATIALAGRRADRLEALVRRIEAAGGRAIALPGDVAVETDATALVERTLAAFGHLDILVNSAGVNEGGGIATLPGEQWRRLIEINLMGTIHVCRAAFPVMAAQGHGDIVNISSTAGRRAAWRFAAYSTSKFGLTGFTEALRQEAGAVGVRVAIVEPGATATEIAQSIADPGWRAMIHEHTHKEGVMAADDVAETVLLALRLPRRANLTRMVIQPIGDVDPMP